MKSEYPMALVALVLWGTLSPVNKLLLNRFNQLQVLLLTCVIAFAVLLVCNIATGSIRRFRKLKGKDYLILSFLGLLGTFLYSFLYIIGIDEMTAQEACVINYLWPIMIVVFSCLILGERMTARKVIAVAISFFGIVVIVTKLNFRDFQMDSLLGVAACLGAAVSYGLFSALNKKWQYDQDTAMTVYYGVSALMTAVLMPFFGQWIPIGNISTALGFVWLGAVGNAIAYLLWCTALLKGDTAKISNLAYITPFLSILFAHLLVGEAIDPYSFLGLFFILLGIAVQVTEKGKKTVSEP